MRFGCDLPYYADPAEIRAFALGVENLGYDYLGFSEHVAASRATAYPTGFTFDQPWHEMSTTMAFLAAVTTRIELNSAMLLATLRHPVLIAKQMAQLDLLSGGRFRVGMSIGWNREEQVALGVDPANRADRFEEMVPLIRRLLTEQSVTHHGRHFQLNDVGIHPKPTKQMPIWLGGGSIASMGEPSDVSLQRAARLADGFKIMAPAGRDPDNALRIAERLHELSAAQGRTIEVEARLLTQLWEPHQWRSIVRRYRESGIIAQVSLGNRILGGSVEHQLDLLRNVVEATQSEWS